MRVEGQSYRWSRVGESTTNAAASRFGKWEGLRIRKVNRPSMNVRLHRDKERAAWGDNQHFFIAFHIIQSSQKLHQFSYPSSLPLP